MKHRPVFILFVGIMLITNIGGAVTPAASAKDQTYNPVINPAEFSTTINNLYLPLTPGKTFIYQGTTEDGKERIEVSVTHETKHIIGVRCVVVSDRVWKNDELAEETLDWYAQDKAGNVWYFGEASKEIEGGKVVSTKGSWEAGIEGAQPGIVMQADPQIGASYRQEYYAGEAEDIAEVLSLSESLSVTFASYQNCLKTKEWTPLEPDAAEHKFYAPGIGLIAEETVQGKTGRTELVKITKDSHANSISKEFAKAIALKKVPGRVTDVETEKKFLRASYVIEIDPVNGRETDVVIDRETGEILAVEH